MFPELKFSEEEIRRRIAAATPETVAGSLAKERRDFFDLLTLFSPAAMTMLPRIREVAMNCRRRYYGKTVSIYAPLYISNSCINGCKYCDFNARHKYERKSLTLDEIRQETDAILAMGIDSLLIVAGEDPVRMSTDFLCEVGVMLKERFSYLSLEVAPQTEEGYRKLFEAGYEGLTLFQETYNQRLYKELHPFGPKSNYEFRLWSQLRAGRGGMRNLGMAFLLGLDDWRLEAASLGAHAIYLQKHCFESKVQFAFPRITATDGGFQPGHPVGDDELELMMLAFRIVFPECGMTISTRENPDFRDRMVQLCADNMSAGSRVTPGGYAILADEDVGQFTLNDSRSVEEVERAIRGNGQEVVRKYWDRAL